MARGRRAWGHRRVRHVLLAGLVAITSAVMAGAAGAASGGATFRGEPAKRKHPAAAPANPFADRGLWIWYLPYANGGNLASIVAAAHRHGIGTLMIKSGDGTNTWSQFNPQLVSTLHANGLRVCAWQYVYGAHPILEAQVGAAAAAAGADCLLIDAEIEYEQQTNNYVQAQTYITELRKLVGGGFLVALAGFPYMDYHPGFPYSVFLGPGGAQYNTPQMYWKDIGDTVDTTFAHTYAYNRLYGRGIYPLGQVYNNPRASQIFRFRQVSRVYGAAGVSWWDWQDATPAGWVAISRPAGSLAGVTPNRAFAMLQKGAQGDLVVWAQEHLVAAGYKMQIDGGFGLQTQAAVESFQQQHGLLADGVIDSATWQALLRYPPARVKWTKAGARTASAAGYTLTLPEPPSSRLPAKRDELAGAGGAGLPRRP